MTTPDSHYCDFAQEGQEAVPSLTHQERVERVGETERSPAARQGEEKGSAEEREDDTTAR